VWSWSAALPAPVDILREHGRVIAFAVAGGVEKCDRTSVEEAT
jgi:hypothetical protein